MEPLAGGAANPRQLPVYLADLKRPVPLLSREELAPGFRMTGPAIITEKVATSWLAPGWALDVDDFGNLVLARGQ